MTNLWNGLIRLLFFLARLAYRWVDRHKVPKVIFRTSLVLGAAMLLALSIEAAKPAPVRGSPTAATSSTAAATPTQAPTQAPVIAPSRDLAIMRIIDGDTLELSDGSTIRPLGIDSCEADTPGGGDATRTAQAWYGEAITLTTEPGVDTDRYGRLLRYVHSDQLGDFGEYQVRYDHTGVYQGSNDASPAYLDQLYAHDLDFAVHPPSGRECGQNPPPTPAADDTVYVPVPDNDDDDGGKSRYCRRHWYC